MRDQQAAMVIARQWERERADPAHAAAQTATLADAVKSFLVGLRAKGAPAGTIDMYECKCGHLVRLLPPRLVEIDVATVEHYFETRRDCKEEGQPASGTLYKEWVALSRVLKSAKRRGRYAADIAVLRPEWVTPNYVPRETFLSWPQISSLLAQLSGSPRAMTAFILGTGARWGEAERARPDDVDVTGGLVHLRGTKTADAARTIPIPLQMRFLLVGVEPPFAPWPYVNRDLARACRAAKIPRVSPNDLRRTFASLLVQDGVPLDVVAKLLGHSSAAMVYRVYGRFTPNALAELASPAVPPVYQRLRKRTHRKEATVRFLRRFVGQDGLEPSANGLRVRCSTN
jgi:integrase